MQKLLPMKNIVSNALKTAVLPVQTTKIFDNRGAPPELIRLAVAAAEKCPTVDKVIFDAFIKDLKGDLGAYSPITKTIIIDMGACITKRSWMKKGILFIPNVWFNLVFTFFHEMGHAFHLEEDPGLIELEKLPQTYEDDANEIAEDSLLEWAKKGTIPRLDEMGWVGEQIKLLLNRLYAQIPGAVSEEIEVEGTTAVADAVHAALASGQYESQEDRAALLQSIDDGFVGIIVGGKRYLTAYDAINTTHSHCENHFNKSLNKGEKHD